MEVVKRGLRELAEREPQFLRELLVELLKADGGLAAAVVEAALRDETARARLAAAIAATIAIPLNTATREDLKRIEEKMATREDLRRIEGRIATKDDLKSLEARMAMKEDLAREIGRLEERMATREDLEREVGRLEKLMATKEDLAGEVRRLEGIMATKDDLKQFATREDLAREIGRIEERMATKEDLKQFATREDLERLRRDLEERMATKEDLKRFATREDLERFATKEDLAREIGRIERRLEGIEGRLLRVERTIERFGLSLEDEARLVVGWLLERRGRPIPLSALRLDGDYEFDVYGSDGEVTVVGEAKVRCGPNDVARLDERVGEAARLRPQVFQGRLVKVLYCMAAMPRTAEEAEKRGVWLVEATRERTTPGV